MTRVICVQPALPTYRIDFFDRCDALLSRSLAVFYSRSDLDGLATGDGISPSWANHIGPIRNICLGLHWQKGALAVPIKRADVVVIAGSPRCLSNIALLVRARLLGARTIWWGHYWSSTSKSWRQLLRLPLMRLTHSVILYTDSETGECRQRMGCFAPGRLHALNNGVDIDAIKPHRLPYQAEKRGRRLLFIGRLTEKANVELLLDALINPRLADVLVEIIGSGPQQEILRNLARELKIEDRIFWHGTETQESAIAEIANRCTLFVYPGGVGLSLIHAMAYGLPAVVHDNRWHHMPEISAFAPGETGFVFEEGKASSLAEVLANAFSHISILDHMSHRSLETVKRSFNTADMARRFVLAVREAQNAKS